MRPLVALLAVSLLSPTLEAQDLPESSPRALMHHAQGVDAYVQEKYADAIAHFRMAIESDPTSYASMFMAGLVAGNMGNFALTDSFYTMAAAHMDQLSPYFRYRLQAQIAGRKGDIATLVMLNRKAAELGPGTKAWYNIAQAGVPRGEAADSRDALRKLDPDKEPMKGWFSYISVYTAAAHQLGDHEDELAMARRGRASYPNDMRAVNREVTALAALGRVADGEAILATARTWAPTPGTSYGDVASQFGLELMAHGNPAAGKKWLESSLQWFDAQTADAMKSPDMRGGRAFALYTLGRFKEMTPIIVSLQADQPNVATWSAWSGIVAGYNGDRAKALDISSRLETRAINTGNNTQGWQALIATSLKDRDAALGYLRAWALKPEWVHRDPNMNKLLGPALTEYLRSK